MRYNTGWFIILAAIILSGCPTFNVRSNYMLRDNQDQGLVVMSVSYTGIWKLALYYRNVAGETKGYVGAGPLFLDWKKPPGVLYYFELPQGEYEFYDWEPYFSLTGDSRRFALAYPVRFRVLPGKATYIGNLHIEAREDRKGYYYEIRDESDRDIKLLHTRLAYLKDDQIVKMLGQVIK